MRLGSATRIPRVTAIHPLTLVTDRVQTRLSQPLTKLTTRRRCRWWRWRPRRRRPDLNLWTESDLVILNVIISDKRINKWNAWQNRSSMNEAYGRSAAARSPPSIELIPPTWEIKQGNAKHRLEMKMEFMINFTCLIFGAKSILKSSFHCHLFNWTECLGKIPAIIAKFLSVRSQLKLVDL